MRTSVFRAALAASLLGLLGCDDATGPSAGETQVALAFEVTAAAQASGLSAASLRETLVVAGTNGTLEIEDLRLIVGEFELEAEDDQECGELEDDCADFEIPAFIVDVPLTGGLVSVGDHEVPPGVYKELEFETRGLDDDEDDDDTDRAHVLELIAELRQTYPAFPLRATMVARGTFTPADGGAPRAFVTYFDAEVEIELELEPPMVLPAAGPTTLVVDLMPDLWFRDGTRVIDLSQFDNRFVEFEFEFEKGVSGVEFDD